MKKSLADTALRFTTVDAVTLLADATATPITIWRAHGRGRVGVTTLSDSYRLVLAGRGDLHGDVWSEAFTTLARSQTAKGPRITIDPAAPHRHSVICGIGDGAQALAGSAIEPDYRRRPRITSARPASARFPPHHRFMRKYAATAP